MTATWIVAAVASSLVAVSGLVFIAKGWGSQSGEASVRNLFRAKGSVAFLIFLSGFAASAYCVYHLAEEQRGELRTRALVATVTGVDGAPSLDRSRAPSEELVGRWLLAFFDDARMQVDAGAADGLSVGQYLVTVPEDVDLDGLRTDELGTLDSDASALLRIVTVREERSVAQLENVAIDAFTRQGDDAAPVRAKQKVVAIPNDERDARDRIHEQTGGAADGGDRRKANLELLRLTEAFLLDHPGSYFVPEVLFARGDAQAALGRMREATWTWEEFLDHFPFSVSADGVRERLHRVGSGQRLR